MQQHTDENTPQLARKPRHHSREEQPKPYLLIRNVLNLIFMIGAIVGVAIYFFSNESIGTIVVLCAMLFKIVECSLRMLRR